ncbi:MAG: leucine-rich repeat protein [Lachnospiraceae bacterium]|nr:leucine-rich repeat protein [Lachnospiraceae bacterium]
MTYEKYTGQEAFVSLSGQPFTHIAAKAFLSCKSIQSLTLPEHLEDIGDWAFAHMQNLTDLYLPASPITFGKQVFLDCGNLKHIHVIPDTSGNEGLSLILGAGVTVLQDMRLLQPHLAGNSHTHTAWLPDFDEALEAFVNSPDAQGFEPVFYGWFNDEDADSTQLPQYLYKRRSQKVYLSFLRLRYSLHLQAPLKKLLQSYLTEHLPTGTEADEHTMTWELLPTYCQDEVIYLQLLEEAGALTADNIPAFIAHLKGACPEAIAYLLRLQADLQENTNFFDNFSL